MEEEGFNCTYVIAKLCTYDYMNAIYYCQLCTCAKFSIPNLIELLLKVLLIYSQSQLQH